MNFALRFLSGLLILGGSSVFQPTTSTAESKLEDSCAIDCAQSLVSCSRILGCSIDSYPTTASSENEIDETNGVDCAHKLISCLQILGCNVNSKPKSGKCAVEGYYWRDYTGEIPHDAIHGGYDSQGRSTYIGQTVYKGSNCEAIPVVGQIRSTDTKITFEWGRSEHEAIKNIKILCSHQPERVEWIDTNTTDIRNLVDKHHFISGGQEATFIVYIGRATTVNNELLVGKVLITSVKELDGLHTTSNRVSSQFTSFHVLAYKV